MARVLDVAQYILERRGPMTAMKLQKLVYYSQAWHLVWDEEPLFTSKIEAWADGPVVPDLFQHHKGSYRVESLEKQGANTKKLSKSERKSIDGVLEFYGERPPQWLSDLTHMEAPWREARAGLPERSISHAEITLEALARYYGSL